MGYLVLLFKLLTTTLALLTRLTASREVKHACRVAFLLLWFMVRTYSGKGTNKRFHDALDAFVLFCTALAEL